VEPGLVGAADEVRHDRDRAVDDQRHVLRQPDRAEEAGAAAQAGHDLGVGRPAPAGESRHLADLDLVAHVIAAHHQHGKLVVGDDEQALDAPRERQAEERGDLLAGRLRRRGHLAHRFEGAGRGPAGAERLGLLDVRRVVRLRAPRDRVLAGVGEHLELVRRETADGAGVRLDRAELEPQPREDARVRVVHRLVARISASRSTSNEYASFIRNSRPRITPKRGRISSRNLTWIW
jgi:hypothetical protein